LTKNKNDKTNKHLTIIPQFPEELNLLLKFWDNQHGSPTCSWTYWTIIKFRSFEETINIHGFKRKEIGVSTESIWAPTNALLLY